MRTFFITTLAALLPAACLPPPEDAGQVESTGSSGETSASSGTGAVPTTGQVPGSSSSGSSGGTTADDGTTLEGDTTEGELLPDLPAECVDWPFMGCGSTRTPTAVSGTTPLGDFDTTLAVFGGFVCGACTPNIDTITLAADPAVIEGLEPSQDVDETLQIRFSSSFKGPAGATVQAWLAATRGGVMEDVLADVTLDYVPTIAEMSKPFDPLDGVVVTGTIAAEGGGWSVAGTFAASYCPQMNLLVPCE